VACRAEVRRIELELGAPELRGPRLAGLFAVLERHRVDPGLISTSGESLGVVVAPGPGLEAALGELGGSVRVGEGLAQVALIGGGLGADGPGAGGGIGDALARRALELLAAAGVTPVEAFVGARRASQAFLVAREDLVAAVSALHAGLVGGALQRA
jgi:hypothetical protein